MIICQLKVRTYLMYSWVSLYLYRFANVTQIGYNATKLYSPFQNAVEYCEMLTPPLRTSPYCMLSVLFYYLLTLFDIRYITARSLPYILNRVIALYINYRPERFFCCWFVRIILSCYSSKMRCIHFVGPQYCEFKTRELTRWLFTLFPINRKTDG